MVSLTNIRWYLLQIGSRGIVFSILERVSTRSSFLRVELRAIRYTSSTSGCGYKITSWKENDLLAPLQMNTIPNLDTKKLISCTEIVHCESATLNTNEIEIRVLFGVCSTANYTNYKKENMWLLQRALIQLRIPCQKAFIKLHFTYKTHQDESNRIICLQQQKTGIKAFTFTYKGWYFWEKMRFIRIDLLAYLLFMVRVQLKQRLTI